MAEPRSLRPLSGFDIVSRGRFEKRHDGHVWTVDLDYFDFGEQLHLYRDHPGASRLIGAVSWIVLAIVLVLEVPQLVGVITFPGPANLALGIAAVAGALERALRLKSSRWLG